MTLTEYIDAKLDEHDAYLAKRGGSHHYQARRRTDNSGPCYEVIEVYELAGRTIDGVRPMGDTKAELIADLERMLADVKRYSTIVAR